jgi:predicted dehydrogenase
MRRAGIIGLGSMGLNHARVLSQIQEVEEILVLESNAETLVPKYCNQVQSFESLFSEKPDFVIIATPSQTHLEVARELLDQGIPILVEKPVAGTLSDARELLTHSAQLQNPIIGVGHVERFNPALIELKKRLSTGVVGEVISVSTVRRGPSPARFIDTGVTTDLGVHDVDVARWLTNSDYQKLHAFGSYSHERSREELIRVSGRMTNGVIVDHSIDWLTPVKVRQVTVLGSEGMLTADLLTADLTFYGQAEFDINWEEIAQLRGGAEGIITRYALRKVEPLRSELEAMFARVDGLPSEPLATIQDGVVALEVVEEIVSQLQPA